MVQLIDLLAVSITRCGFYNQRAISSFGERRWRHVEKYYPEEDIFKYREGRININSIYLKEVYYE